MGKSMVTEKVRISPYLHREITDLVDDGDFASFSDLVNVAVSSFLSRNFGAEEEKSGPSFEMQLMLLYMMLIEKGIITKEDMNNFIEKATEGELDESQFFDFFSEFIDENDIDESDEYESDEYDMFDMLDTAKEMEKEKSYELAEKTYQDIIEKFPEDFEPDFDLGCLYLKTGKEEGGRSQLEIALQKATEMEEEKEIIEMISSEIDKIKS